MYTRFLYLLLILCCSCKNEPEPISYGKDPCEYCKMTITDQQFGAEIVTDKGRVYKFDAIECMIHYIKESQPKLSNILAIPYNNPALLQSNDSLVFVISPKIKSPMGANLAAITNKNAVDTLLGKEVSIYTWKELYSKIIK